VCPGAHFLDLVEILPPVLGTEVVLAARDQLLEIGWVLYELVAHLAELSLVPGHVDRADGGLGLRAEGPLRVPAEVTLVALPARGEVARLAARVGSRLLEI